MVKKSFLVLFLVTSSLFADVPDEKLHKKCIYPIVTVFSKEAGSCGSGVIVRSEKKEKRYLNAVVTCAHCVMAEEGKYHISTFTYENSSEIVNIVQHEAKVFAKSPKRDIAVIFFISDREMPTADLGLDEKFFIGNKINSVGCGSGDTPRLGEGLITGVKLKPTFFSPNCIRFSAYTVNGDSGGGLFNSEHKLIGLVNGIRSELITNEKFHQIAYAVEISSVKSWNEEEKDKLKFLIRKENLPDEPFKAIVAEQCQK